MDIGIHMEDHRRESLHVKLYHKKPGPHLEAGPRDKRDPKGGQARADRRDRQVGRAVAGSRPPPQKEERHRMKGWYPAAVDRAPPLNWNNLERIKLDQVDLYCHISTPEENIPVSVEPFPVDDLVPT